MAKTVNIAFDTFLRDVVRISKSRSDLAKISKDNLIKEIAKFPSDEIFPTLHSDLRIDYGSFARKTKIRPLDDIDMMVILHAEGNRRYQYGNYYSIQVQANCPKQLSLCNLGTNVLNSIKVVNKFKEYLKNVPNYTKAEIKRNQEAITLNLSSYEWNFDIVPCFITSPDIYGKTFYLIPDGTGNWKPTDPRIDKQRTTAINSNQNVFVLDMVRLMKYWTKRPTMPTMKSYFLENLILQYYSGSVTSVQWVDRELPKLFGYIYYNVQKSLNDPKGFQGDINHLTYEERLKIQEKAKVDYNKAMKAIGFEGAGNMTDAIKLWGEIFGDEFPKYC